MLDTLVSDFLAGRPGLTLSFCDDGHGLTGILAMRPGERRFLYRTVADLGAGELSRALAEIGEALEEHDHIWERELLAIC